MLYAGLHLSRKRLNSHLLDAEGATVDVGASGNASDLARTAEERPRARGVGVRSCHASALGRTAPRHRRRQAPSTRPRRRTESPRSGLAPGERDVDGGLKCGAPAGSLAPTYPLSAA